MKSFTLSELSDRELISLISGLEIHNTTKTPLYSSLVSERKARLKKVSEKITRRFKNSNSTIEPE